MKAVILAGGKGTRLGDITKDMPKPMLKIGGKPLLEHQINLLKHYGIVDIIILTGYLSEVIQDYFKDGSDFGVTITYSKEDEPLGTTGGLKEVEDKLTEDFILLYGDMIVGMNLKKFIDFHKTKNSIFTLALHSNDHPFSSDLVELDNNKKIVNFKTKPNDRGHHRNQAAAAMYILSPKIFNYIKKGVKGDFVKDIYPIAFKQEEMYGYMTSEYLKDVGTLERIGLVEKDYANGKIARLNCENKRKAIFIDRDGVINKDVVDLSKHEDFELLPKAVDAIKLINSSEYLAIVVTNQAVISKGLASFEDIENLHKKMDTLLGKERAKLDAIYFCPHYPEQGWEGEVKELKIDCDCRKPKTGMVLKAAKDFNIDVENSFMIGDLETDMQLANNAGMKGILVRGDQEKGFWECSVPFRKTESLYEAVRIILSEGKKE